MACTKEHDSLVTPNNLRALLTFLNSLQRDHVVEALAHGGRGFQKTIMDNIRMQHRRPMYLDIAAFEGVTYTPPEWETVASYLSAFSANAANSSPEDRKIHKCVWDAHFKTDEWLRLAFEEYHLNPVLLGPDLPSIRDKIEKGERVYTVLLANDWSGDLTFTGREDDHMTFRNSLQDHTYDESTGEISFSSGIKLNINSLIRPDEVTVMPDLQVLFQREDVQTSYCPWIGPEKEPIKTVKGPDIIGKEGVIKSLKDVNPICGFTLSYSKQHTVQHLFATPSSGSLKPIHKDGEKYSDGIIQGWIK
jgi:hypothetical protein